MKKSIGTVAVVSAAAFVLAACSSTSASVGGGPDVRAAGSPEPEPVAATTNVDNTKVLAAGKTVQITAVSPWVIENVSATGPEVNSDEPVSTTVWTSKPITPAQMTTFTATMHNPETNKQVRVIRNVLGGPAKSTFAATASPEKGNYGIGAIPMVAFDVVIPEKDRAEVASHLNVIASPTPIAGGWRWINSSTAAFRPTSGYLPANSTIKVEADIDNVMIHRSKADGGNAWGEKNDSVTFKTGKATVIKLDARTHRGVMIVDGKTVRKFPISTGRSGFTTRSGVKTFGEKYEVTRMTNVGVTNQETYDLQVPYAMRLTESGEFLHGAPWNGNIGYANTSHGCTNLTLSDAKYIFDRIQMYGPVETVHTGRAMESWNGPGALWNVPAAKWVRTKIT